MFARVSAQLDFIETKIIKQTELMKKSEDEICAAKRLVTKTVEEVTRFAREHETVIHTKLTEIKPPKKKIT